MADEITKTADELEVENKQTEAQKRITQLSEKVRLTSEERDEKARLLGEESSKREAAEKERDFYAGFSDVVSTNPLAKDHKDDILAKVKSGYTVQDATFAVLGAAGKLGNTLAPTPQSPAGGSSPTALPQGGVKPIGEMTQDERRDELAKAISWN